MVVNVLQSQSKIPLFSLFDNFLEQFFLTPWLSMNYIVTPQCTSLLKLGSIEKIHEKNMKLRFLFKH